MEIFRILDELELMIKDSRKVPLSNGKVIIDAYLFLDRIDRIRAILPKNWKRPGLYSGIKNG